LAQADTATTWKITAVMVYIHACYSFCVRPVVCVSDRHNQANPSPERTVGPFTRAKVKRQIDRGMIIIISDVRLWQMGLTITPFTTTIIGTKGKGNLTTQEIIALLHISSN
jgi:hypothetical protein